MTVYALYYRQDEFEASTLLDLYANKVDAEREAERGQRKAEYAEHYYVRELTVK